MAIIPIEELKQRSTSRGNIVSIEELKRQNRPQEPQFEQRPMTDILSSSEPVKSTGDPMIDRLIGIQKEFVGPIAQGANTAAFGLPKVLTRMIAGEDYAKQAFPEQSTTAGKALRFGSEAFGYAKGGAAKLSRKAGEKIAADTFAKGALKGAVEGGVFGATQVKGDAKSIPDIFKQQSKQAAEFAAVGGTLGAMFGLGANATKWLKTKNQLNLAERANKSLTLTKQNFYDKYKTQYDKYIKNGTGNISMKEPFENLINNSDDALNALKGNAEFKELLSAGDANAKRLMKILENINDPSLVNTQISIQEADKLYKFIKGLPGISNKLSRGAKQGWNQVDFTNSERILLDFSNDIKGKVLELVPDMRFVNTEFATAITNFKQARPYLKWNNAVTNFKNLNTLDPAIVQKLETVLPKDIMRDIRQLNKTHIISQILKIWGYRAGVGGTVYGAGRIVGRR